MNTPVFTLSPASFPTLLKEINPPPKLLYCKGNKELLNQTCISIVGTRKYTEYGEIMTTQIIQDLSVLDVVIVSGLAKGIDTIAHTQAIKNNLKTIAVLGSGIDYIYPIFNTKLAQQILDEGGLIISEYTDKTEPRDYHFPQRNRIISGLCVATIMIESSEKSGALITADYALKQGREIFTITGDVDRETSIGPLQLLQRGGAYPIKNGKEIIEILKLQPHLRLKYNKKHKYFPVALPAQKKQIPLKYNLNPIEQKIFSSLSKRQLNSLDRINQKTGLPIEKILQTLSILEIQDLISIKNGKYCIN
jgi:DNA processing protein